MNQEIRYRGICTNEIPINAWPEDCVNVKDKTVLDLGCGFFGETQSFKAGKGPRQTHLNWYAVIWEEMISTSEHWLNLGAKKVVGVDMNRDDVNHLNKTLGGERALFLNQELGSSEDILKLIKEFNIDVLKADIEGREDLIFLMKDEDFKLIKEYYVECHSPHLVDMMLRKLNSCNYEIRNTLRVNSDDGPYVIFAYKKDTSC